MKGPVQMYWGCSGSHTAQLVSRGQRKQAAGRRREKAGSLDPRGSEGAGRKVAVRRMRVKSRMRRAG